MKVALLSEFGNQTFARLISPPFEITNDSCLSFKYLLHTSDLQMYVKVELAQNDTAAPDSVETLAFATEFSSWASVTLDVRGTGWRRLVIDASYVGTDVSKSRQIYVDSVSLSDTPCSTARKCTGHSS